MTVTFLLQLQMVGLHASTQCVKITKNVLFEFFNFVIFIVFVLRSAYVSTISPFRSFIYMLMYVKIVSQKDKIRWFQFWSFW